MADICDFKVIVKGKKNACYAFYYSTKYLEYKEILDESGTDDSYNLFFEGSCKWGMDMYCVPEDNPQPVEIPEDFDELEDFGIGYYSSTVKDRAVLFGLEVLCNWTVEGYEEELGEGNFEHYKGAEEIYDECPQKLLFDCYDGDEDYDGLLKCSFCDEYWEPDDLTSKKSPEGKIVHACMYCIDEHSLESWEDA